MPKKSTDSIMLNTVKHMLISKYVEPMKLSPLAEWLLYKEY